MTVKENQISASGDHLSCSPDIAIHVKNRTAIISGVACSREEIVQAETAVNSMSGIDQVFNLVLTNTD